MFSTLSFKWNLRMQCGFWKTPNKNRGWCPGFASEESISMVWIIHALGKAGKWDIRFLVKEALRQPAEYTTEEEKQQPKGREEHFGRKAVRSWWINKDTLQKEGPEPEGKSKRQPCSGLTTHRCSREFNNFEKPPSEGVGCWPSVQPWKSEVHHTTRLIWFLVPTDERAFGRGTSYKLLRNKPCLCDAGLRCPATRMHHLINLSDSEQSSICFRLAHQTKFTRNSLLLHCDSANSEITPCKTKRMQHRDREQHLMQKMTIILSSPPPNIIIFCGFKSSDGMFRSHAIKKYKQTALLRGFVTVSL